MILEHVEWDKDYSYRNVEMTSLYDRIGDTINEMYKQAA